MSFMGDQDYPDYDGSWGKAAKHAWLGVVIVLVATLVLVVVK